MRRTTDRWARRLAAAVAVSVLVHAAPVLLARFVKPPAPLDIDMHVNAVEIGLEYTHPGAQTPVAPPSPAPPRPATPPRPAHPSPAPPHPAVAHAHVPPPPEPEPLPPLPVPNVHLTEPQLAMTRPPAHDPLTDFHETPDAGTPSTPPLELPPIATAAGNLAPMVPRGALITVLVRSDRVRRDPNAAAVRRVLAAIPDWQDMIGGTDLDPIDDLDTLLLAAANPTGAGGQPPDWFVLARGAAGSDLAMRRAVETMVADSEPMAPSPAHPPALDGGAPSTEALAAHDHPDAGRHIWRNARDGVEVATVERYGARRDFLMLGDGLAAIALPGQVPALLSTLSQRGTGMVGSDDPRLSVLLEGEGLRNLISFNTWRGPFPIPSRAGLGVYQDLGSDSAPTGGVELLGRWQYDSPEQAEHAREMFEYSRGRWHVMITERLGAPGGLNRLFVGAVARVVGVDIAALERALDALEFRTDGDRLVIHARMTSTQVEALLHLAALGME